LVDQVFEPLSKRLSNPTGYSKIATAIEREIDDQSKFGVRSPMAVSQMQKQTENQVLLAFDERVVCGFCGTEHPWQSHSDGVSVPVVVAKLLRSLIQHGLFTLWQGVREDGRTKFLHLERFEDTTCTATCQVEWIELNSPKTAKTSYGRYRRFAIGCLVPDPIHSTAKIFDEQSWFFTQADVSCDNKNIRFEMTQTGGSLSGQQPVRFRAQVNFGDPMKGEMCEVFIPITNAKRAVRLLSEAPSPRDIDLVLFDNRQGALAYLRGSCKLSKHIPAYLLKLTCRMSSMSYAVMLDSESNASEPSVLRRPKAQTAGRLKWLPVGVHVREFWASLHREQIVLEACNIAGK
jgi:hypothetical protein